MQEIKLIPDRKGLQLKGIQTENEIKVTATHPWDAAHTYRNEKLKGIHYIEPEIEQKLFDVEKSSSLKLKSSPPHYLKNWPDPPKVKDNFIWHLLDDFSELRKASDRVWKKVQQQKCIKIAHIDTGYQPEHPALPQFLNHGISFVKGEEGKTALDVTNNSIGEQEGHGTATMAILSGRKVFFDRHGISYSGHFGGIPFAEIIPIRISDTVALIRSQNFVKAINYAINTGCEVVSMSMAGAPTKEWAKVVNEAYRRGITIVTAAGNSWNKGAKRLLPKRMLYPARWQRIIAATGVTANHHPYLFDSQIALKSEGGEHMQGNYGPRKAMKNAIAAYTPNTPWATMNEVNDDIYYRFDGGGTSSATPQVAAAVALWLSYYKDEIKQEIKTPDHLWKKVEAVKHALYSSADKSSYAEWEKHYGQGILKANKALDVFPNFDNLQEAKEARATLNGIADFLGIMLRMKNKNISEEEEIQREMFSTEILQELHYNEALHHYLDIDEELWTDDQKDAILNTLLHSPTTSQALKDHLKHL